MTGIPPRRVCLVVIDGAGGILGRLPEFPVATPWWQEVRPVVEGARERFGLDVVVLRLFDSELPRPQGGGVMYVAQAQGPIPPDAEALLEPFDGVMSEHARRLRWADPGGPGADLAWAEDALRVRRLERVGPAEQLRCWNLSSIWRLPLAGGAAWLKVVPPFFAHEGDILRRLQGGPVPRLLAHDGDRILLDDIPGVDQHGAELPELLEIVSTLVDLQAEWIGRTDELLAIGLPDWRGLRLAELIEDVVARRGGHVQESAGARWRRSSRVCRPGSRRSTRAGFLRPSCTVISTPATCAVRLGPMGVVRGSAASPSSTGAIAVSATRCSTCRPSSIASRLRRRRSCATTGRPSGGAMSQARIRPGRPS